jgi:hypothetical protein
MTDQPDLTIDELKDRLAGAGVVIGRSSLGRFLLVIGLTRKKKTQHAAEQDRPDVAEARAAWRKTQPSLSPAQLVSKAACRVALSACEGSKPTGLEREAAHLCGA